MTNDITIDVKDVTYIPTTEQWSVLYWKHGSKIVRSLMRFGSKHDCEDAVQHAITKILGLDPKHHLEEPLVPRTEAQWVCFIQMQARAWLGHKYEHEARWTWAGGSSKELHDAYRAAFADRTLGKRARVERLRNIRRQIKCLADAQGVRNAGALSPAEHLDKNIVRAAVREMVEIVCRECRVSDRDREVFVRAVLDEDAGVADDLLGGCRGNRDTIVCRVKAKLLKHGRTAFGRGIAIAEAKLWRMGA